MLEIILIYNRPDYRQLNKLKNEMGKPPLLLKESTIEIQKHQKIKKLNLKTLE